MSVNSSKIWEMSLNMHWSLLKQHFLSLAISDQNSGCKLKYDNTFPFNYKSFKYIKFCLFYINKLILL